jgi:hypothetical protein
MKSIIIEQIYKKVEISLKNKENQEKIKKYIKEYISKNNEILLNPYPIEHLPFTDEDRNIMYEIANITEKEISTAIKNIHFVNSSWKTINNPFNFLMLSFIRFFEQQKNREMTESCLLYLSFQFYGMQHVRYLRYVQKETMQYTIEHLSNKHDIKQYGSVLKAIYKKVLVSHQTYEKNLLSEDDKKLIDYVVSLNNRIKQWIIGIMLEYKKNKESNKYFNAVSDELHDEENYRITSNTSMDLTILTNKIGIEIVKDPVNLKLVEISAKITDVSYPSLIRTVNDIKRNEDHKIINEFIKLILELFIVEGKKKPENIASKDFINFILALYNQSNTVDQRLIRIKEILDEWLQKNSEIYLKTNRVATKVNWRKAVFIYFCLSIQYYYIN